MLTSIFILVFSLALLVYWLHYTCLLLVKEAKAGGQVAYPLFSFSRVKAHLNAGTYDAKLHKALDRDYTVLTYFIDRAPVGVEAQLLVWNYRLMRCWFALSRTAFPLQARRTLETMTDVLTALATKLRDATPAAG